MHANAQVAQPDFPDGAAAPAATAEDQSLCSSTSALKVRAPTPQSQHPPLPAPPVPILPEQSWKRLLLALRRFTKAAETASQQEARSRSGSGGTTGSAAAAAAGSDSALSASKLRRLLDQNRNKPISDELEVAREELQHALDQLPVHRVAQALSAGPSAPAGTPGQAGASASRASLFGNMLGPCACAASRALMLVAAHCRLVQHYLDQQRSAELRALDSLQDQDRAVAAMEAANRAVELRVRECLMATVLVDALLQYGGLPALPLPELTALTDALGPLWLSDSPAMTCAPTQAAQVAGDESDGASGPGAGAGALRPAAACPGAVSLEFVARVVRLCADEVLVQRDKWAEEEVALRRRARPESQPGGSRAALPPMPPPGRRPGQHSSADVDDESEPAVTIDGLSNTVLARHWHAVREADVAVRSSSNKGTIAKKWMDAYCTALRVPVREIEGAPLVLRMCVLHVRDQLPSLLKPMAAAAAAGAGTTQATADGGALGFQPWLPSALVAGAGCSLGVSATSGDGCAVSGGASGAASATIHHTAALRASLARVMTEVAVNGRCLSLLVSCDMLSRLAALTTVVSALRGRGLPHPDSLLASEAASGGSSRSSSGRGYSVGRAALQGYGPIFLRFSLATTAGSAAAAAPGSAQAAAGMAQAAAGMAQALQVSLVPGGMKAAQAVRRICGGAYRQAGSGSSMAAAARRASGSASSQVAAHLGSTNVIELPVGGLSAFDPEPVPGQADVDEADGAPAAGTASQQQGAQKQPQARLKGTGKGPQTPPARPGAHAQALQQYRQQLKDSVQRFGCARLVCPGFEALHAAALVVAQVEAQLREEHDPAKGPCPVLDVLPRPGPAPVAHSGRDGGGATGQRGSSASGSTANGRGQKAGGGAGGGAGGAAGAGAGASSLVTPIWPRDPPLDYAVEAAVEAVAARSLGCSASVAPEDWQCRQRYAVIHEISRLMGLLTGQSSEWKAPMGNRLADGPGAHGAARKAPAATASAARPPSRGELSWAHDYNLELLVLLRTDGS
ncbi:hypothetical protein HXX76_006371 [Chlamydomonas incerta]|uniref:Uncharacterized protein n=1 Tax=Chlamydomonas incerta TaxID=51695 RepID=A0A835TEN4_CHLIN|nr:hypothetical protein HXX76_006371 [Chlamydomonas incerta]|eukprot:KAG2436851.1 hypothetical protein HXX76_006371 [Chlamydomonas incerta]